MSSFANSFPIRSSASSAPVFPEITQNTSQAPQIEYRAKKSGESLFSNTILPLASGASSSPVKQKKTEQLQLHSSKGLALRARQIDLFAQANIGKTHPSIFTSMGTNIVPRAVSPPTRIEGTPPSSPLRSASSTLKPPKSPDRNPRREITSRFVLRALDILGAMKINADMPITPMIGMRGEHSQIYQVHSERALVPGISNNDIYIKIFQEQVLRKEGNTIERKFLTNILTQYEEIRSAGIRVVNIFNVDTASTDGYLVVEKLTPFSIPWDASTKLSDLSEENKAHLDYLLTLFRFGLTNPSAVAIDIHRGNFGLDKSGNLVLLDLMEEDDDDPYAFRLYAKNHALSLSNGSDEIYTLFKEAIRDIAPQVYILLFDES